MSRFSCYLALVVPLLYIGTAGAEDPIKLKAKKPATPSDAAVKPAEVKGIAAAKKATHKVEKGPFKVEVSLKGILESSAMTEVLISPEAFTPENRGQLRVLKAVDHGTKVHKGDQLVWFDMERLDQIITDQEKDHALADLSFKLAYEDLIALEKATPLDLAYVERAKKLACLLYTSPSPRD